MLRLIAFGGLALERDGQPGGGAAAQRRRLALLTYLAVAGARGVSRDRIVALLWPESDAERARHALAQTLYVLRHELGHEDVILGTTELRLNPAVLTSDVGDFLDAAGPR